MRHLKTDVSHRMRRRPSIFTAPWFRLILGAGVVVILGLLLGPPVAGWLRGSPSIPTGRAPRSAPVVPRAPQPPTPEGTVAVAAPPEPTPRPAAPEERTPPAVGNGVAAKPDAPKAAAVPADSAAGPSAPQGGGLFRIQVGAFLDHRNADRLTERLRGEGFEVIVNSVVEESRTMYRVLAMPADGAGNEPLVQRLRELGYAPELTDDVAAVTRPVPLASAVETSRRLRAQGIRVRLEQRPSSAALRVVRVGAYPSAEEAERARGELAARGYEGFVIRER